MKILEKYVLKSFVISFLFCVLLLIVLGVIGDILGFMDDIFKNDIPFLSIMLFYLYLAPFAFVNMVPFAALLSAVYVFNSLSKNHEITAVVASGISLWKLLRPVLIVTFLICLFTFIVNNNIVPQTMKKANVIRHSEIERGEGKVDSNMQDIAIYGKGDQIVFARSFDPTINTLHNVTIHKQDKEHQVTQKISARLVKWRKSGYWFAEDVIIFNIDNEGNFRGNPEVHKNKKVYIGETPEEFINNEWDPKFMTYSALKKYIKLFNFGSKQSKRRLLVDLNYKLAFPFTALITVLIGVPFSIETGRANALIGMARGITVAIMYLPVMAISLALGKGGILPPVLSAWLSNILFILAGVYFVNKKS